VTRGLDDLLADLTEAADAAAELVGLGKERWDAERPLRLAGEAVIGRLGDVATKLPDEVIEATPEIPWKQVKGMRIIAAHAYHRIDYEEVWVTLRDDVPRLAGRSTAGVRRKTDTLRQSRAMNESGSAPRERASARWLRLPMKAANTL
jgi:uncharacterized protein with HEPN domain